MGKLCWTLMAAALTLAGTSGAKADTIKSTTNGSTFQSNDSLHWATLGNNVSVSNGTVATSVGGLQTTIDFALGGPGSTQVQCPAAGCSWSGNFSPGQTLLTTVNSTTGKGQGALTLTFSPQDVAGVGFHIEPNPTDLGKFQAQIAAFDGATSLGTFFATGNATSGEDNTALFFGLQDLTGTDITSIQIGTFNCAAGADPHCTGGFAIEGLQLWEGSAYPAPTPEPASLMLFGSGLGALGLLRRKLLNRI